jgi:hypothetical protein
VPERHQVGNEQESLAERLEGLERRLVEALDRVRALRDGQASPASSNGGPPTGTGETPVLVEIVVGPAPAPEAEPPAEPEPEHTSEPEPVPSAARSRAPVRLAFASGPDGYRLVELAGELPAVGAVLELPADSGASGRHLVARVGRAHLPGGAVDCAYLLPLD